MRFIVFVCEVEKEDNAYIHGFEQTGVAFLQVHKSKLLFRQPERRSGVPDQRRSIRYNLNNFVPNYGTLFKQNLAD
jgi:hypothetical protein